MFHSLKKNWRQLRDAAPGRRFRQFYDLRKAHRSGHFSWSRVLTIFLGLILLLGGLGIGWLPGPGGFIAIFGLALLAQEFRPLARLLDWGELKLRASWRWLARKWRALSSTGQLAIAIVVLATGVSAGVAAYQVLVH